MSWLSALFGDNQKAVEEFKDIKPAKEEISGLNFRTALEAHIKWKLRLKGVIDGTNTEKLDPDSISVDNQCVLGKWLYSEGQQKFGDTPAFKDVISAHAHFHKCAGHTLELALKGKTAEAEQELVAGAFAKASLDISRHLMRLWHDVDTKH